jgi:Flp pilus assembly protein TadD
VWLEAAESRRDVVALKKAVEALSTAASHSDASSDTLTDLGRALLGAGDAVAAERALRKATAKLPVDPAAYLHLSAITGRDGRVQEARDSLVRYVTLIGDARPVPAIATRIAQYSLRLGEPAVAMRWIDRAVEEGGPTPALVALKRRASSQATP